jgi:EAL domain-containing protein (putative c-di-GMP-specific phosphodiesterase class I)
VIQGAGGLGWWTHPRLGRIPPDTFIPLAEQTGVILPLTQWVLETALAQCQEWQQKGLLLNVAVNLSMRTLHDSQIPQIMAALLRQYDVAAARVTLEITESALMVDPERVHAVLTQLSRLGLRTSIDDFGTGYSSLRYLSRLPVNEIKIDRSFVMEMATRPGAATIIRSLIDLGHKLGLEVVAEGVETLAEWQLLAEWGCDAVQGYYLSRPVTAADLGTWLRRSPHGITRDVA